MFAIPYYRTLPYKILRRIRRNVSLKIGNRKLIVPIDNYGSMKAVLWQPSWKTQIIRWLLLEYPDTFVDIGANIGQTLLDFISAGIKTDYYGFEPNIECLHFLNQIIHLNHLEKYNLLPTALSDKSSLLPLYLIFNNQTDSSASILRNMRLEKKFDVEYVPAFRFDDIWEIFRNPKIGLIKIDVEGAELKVLQGMIKTIEKQRPLFICEVLFVSILHDFEDYSIRVKTLNILLHDLHYHVYLINKNHSHLEKLTEMKQIPLGIWTRENADQCDYLFLPAEKKNKLGL